MVARRYQLSLQMRLRRERFNEDFMVWASDSRISESNHCSFYRCWALLVVGASEIALYRLCQLGQQNQGDGVEFYSLRNVTSLPGPTHKARPARRDAATTTLD